jgi:hypothetical protein
MKMKQLLMTTIAIFGLAFISNAQVPNYVPSNGIVGWWPFNGNANDESGNGNNGTVNGATLTTDRLGNVNTAFSFNGAITSKIDVVLTSPLTSSKSYSLWFKIPINFINEYCHLITGNIGNEYLSLNGNNPVYISAGTVGKYYDGKTGLFSNIFLNDNNWHHLILIHNYQNSIASLYIDGDLNGTLSSPNFSSDPNITQLAFGSSVIYAASQTLFGQLDDIGIWNRALTEEEITSLYYGSSVGINEVSQSNLFSVFPNPAQNVINVNLDAKLVGSVFTIYDNIGKVVKSGKLNSANTTIELNDLSGGIYTFSIGENKKQTFKVIKE